MKIFVPAKPMSWKFVVVAFRVLLIAPVPFVVNIVKFSIFRAHAFKRQVGNSICRKGLEFSIDVKYL